MNTPRAPKAIKALLALEMASWIDLAEDRSHDHQQPRHFTDSRGMSGCWLSKVQREEVRGGLVGDTARISHFDRLSVKALSAQNSCTNFNLLL